MNHNLSLDVSNSNNEKVIRVFDTSFYYSDEVTDNYLFEVLPVNKSNWITFPVTRHFSVVLNSSNLGYKKVSFDDELINLPDGIYEFKISYAPNFRTVKHFYYLRVTQLLNKIQKKRQDLLNDRCSISREEFVLNRDTLRDIEEYLTAAKYMIEECHNKDKGKELYEYSQKLLNDYSNECKC